MVSTSTKSRVAGADSSRKLLQVLMLFSPQKPLWTVKEIGDELRLTQSMVYRYVGLLREVGLLDNHDGNSYRVTDLVRPLADAAEATREPIGEIALPWLVKIRDEFNETVYVTRRSGPFNYVVERVETRQPVRLVFEVGQALPLHQGATGRLTLAEMSYSNRAGYFENLGVDRLRYNAELLKDESLDVIKREGFTESHEESGEGLWGVAATIRNGNKMVAALGVAAPLFRTNASQRKLIHKRVIEAANAISETIQNPKRTP